MKKISLITVSLLASFVLSACGPTQKSSPIQSDTVEQSLAISLDAEISTLDPALSQDTVSNEVINQVMEGLYRLDEEGTPTLAMAKEDPLISQDGLTYTFSIRDNAIWSDGTPVTAHDFVYAWQRVANPTTASNYANEMYIIKNGKAINLENMNPENLGAVALDEKTLEVTLEKPLPYFISKLTGITFFPVNKEFYEEQNGNFATNSQTLIYNGPFILEDWEGTSNEWTYTKNIDYWDQENVALEKITNQVIKEVHTGFNLYQNNELDKINLTGEFAQQNKDNPEFTSNLAARSVYIEIDHKSNTALQNKNLRQALAYVINNENIANNLIQDGTVGINGLIPTQLMVNPDSEADFRADAGDYLVYDKNKAVELWNSAKKDLGIEQLELELLIDDDDGTKKIAEAIQAEIETYLDGISITLKRVPKKMRVELGDAGDFDLLLSGWGADSLDATSFLDLFISDSSFNSGRFNNADYDKLLNQVHTKLTNEPQARYEAMIQAEAILMEEAGVIPLFQKSISSLINPAVTGLTNYPVGAVNYKYTTIEKEK